MPLQSSANMTRSTKIRFELPSNFGRKVVGASYLACEAHRTYLPGGPFVREGERGHFKLSQTNGDKGLQSPLEIRVSGYRKCLWSRCRVFSFFKGPRIGSLRVKYGVGSEMSRRPLPLHRSALGHSRVKVAPLDDHLALLGCPRKDSMASRTILLIFSCSIICI